MIFMSLYIKEWFLFPHAKRQKSCIAPWVTLEVEIQKKKSKRQLIRGLSMVVCKKDAFGLLSVPKLCILGLRCVCAFLWNCPIYYTLKDVTKTGHICNNRISCGLNKSPFFWPLLRQINHRVTEVSFFGCDVKKRHDTQNISIFC